MESVFMADLSWPVFAQRIAEQAPVFIPLGATEQHGWLSARVLTSLAGSALLAAAL